MRAGQLPPSPVRWASGGTRNVTGHRACGIIGIPPRGRSVTRGVMRDAVPGRRRSAASAATSRPAPSRSPSARTCCRCTSGVRRRTGSTRAGSAVRAVRAVRAGEPPGPGRTGRRRATTPDRGASRTGSSGSSCRPARSRPASVVSAAACRSSTQAGGYRRIASSHDRPGVVQAGQVRDGRRPPAPSTVVEFGVQPRGHLRMLREQVIRPAQRVRGGLVTGEQQRQHLVAQVRVGHRMPGLVVTRGEQPRQHVLRPRRRARRSAISREINASMPDIASRRASSARLPSRLLNATRMMLPPGPRIDRVDGVPDGRGVGGGKIGREDGTGQDAQRGLRRTRRARRRRRAVAPARPPWPVPRRPSPSAYAAMPLVVERGLDQPPLPLVVLALAGQQPVAEDAPSAGTRPLHRRPSRRRGPSGTALVDQDRAGGGRIGHETDRPAAESAPTNGPPSRARALQEPRRVSGHAVEMAGPRPTRGRYVPRLCQVRYHLPSMR